MPTVKAYQDFIKKYKKKNCPPYSGKKKEQLKKLAEKFGYEGKGEKTKKVYTDYIKKHKKESCPPYSNKKKEQLKRLAERLGYEAKQPVKKQAKPPVKKQPEVKKGLMLKLPVMEDHERKNKMYREIDISTGLYEQIKEKTKRIIDGPKDKAVKTFEDTILNNKEQFKDILRRYMILSRRKSNDVDKFFNRMYEQVKESVKTKPQPVKKEPVKKEPVKTPEPEKKESSIEWLVNNYSGLKTTREWNNFKKKFGDSPALLNILGDKRNAIDFYPTPPRCILDHEELVDLVKEADDILEPSAGFGSLVWTLQKINPTATIYANELMTDFKAFNSREHPDVEWSYGDFLKHPVSDWEGIDLIVCNPPFSNGNDKRFYYDFYYKCLQIMNSGKKGIAYDMIFLCPENELHKEYGIPSKINRTKAEQLLNMLGKPSKISPKQWKLMKNGDDYDNEALEYLEGLAPIQINYISDCKFKTTGARVSVYHVISYGQG